MTPGRLKVLAVLAVLAAIDIAATVHAIVTRHVAHAAAAGTTPSTGAPTVMTVGAALGCLTSFLLLVAIACVIIDARWASRRPEASDQPNQRAKIIDV